MAAATTSSPNTSPQRPNCLLLVTIRRGPFVAGGDELEEQVRGFGFERDVADLVDDEQRVAAEADEFGLQPAGVVGVGEPCDPVGGGGEQDPVPGLAGPDRQADGEVGLAGAGRAEEHHVVLGGDEVQGAQVRDEVAFEAAGVVEVELLQALAGREPGGADAALTAVGLAGGDFALQAGDQELLVRPGLGAGPFGQPVDRLAQRRCLQRPGQERDLGGQVTARSWPLSWRGWPSRHPAVECRRGRGRCRSRQGSRCSTSGSAHRAQHPDPLAAQRLRGGDVLGVGDGLVPGPDPFVVGDEPALAEHPHPRPGRR